MLQIGLLLLPPLVGILYAVLEHFGVWDRLSGRDKAVEGLRRLRSCAGYPVNWIYNDKEDKRVFEALCKRIKNHTQEAVMRALIDAGGNPMLIATAGHPLPINGVDDKWPQEGKFFYSDNHPVLMGFAVSRSAVHNKGKGDKACTLRELGNG
jgi:hypothetical protein